MPLHDYVQYFPFSKIRAEQKAAIEFAIDAYESGKKAVLLELATGVGKSATGITIARYVDTHLEHDKNDSGPLTGAYVLTTQKILQQQYMSDFGPTSGKNLMRSIKSSNNYSCKFYPDQSCAQSKRVLTQLSKQLNGTEFQKQCKESCTYSLEKSDFIESPLSITNFSYFLAETTYSGKLEPRGMLVIDECHNIESELGKFIEVTFSEKFSKDVLKCKVPVSEDQAAIHKWIGGPYKKALQKHLKHLEKLLHSKIDTQANFSDISKQYELLDKHVCKLDRFLEVYTPQNWVLNIIKQEDKKSYKKFEFKPIDIGVYNDTLFKLGARILMMSATVVDKDVFCDSVGLRPSDVAYLRIPSPFPVKNKPVHYIPVGSMSKSKVDQTLPMMVEAVRMLLEKHSDEKGIIHTSNFKIAKYLVENLKTGRLITHDSSNRDVALKTHYESAEPTVIISPSMMEGVDLADESSRFQIICKIPFPYLGDEVIKKRMEKNKFWYPYMTAKAIIQSLGRSIRNENDYATSYILDADWSFFYEKNRHMFPDDFKKSLQ